MFFVSWSPIYLAYGSWDKSREWIAQQLWSVCAVGVNCIPEKWDARLNIFTCTTGSYPELLFPNMGMTRQSPNMVFVGPRPAFLFTPNLAWRSPRLSYLHIWVCLYIGYSQIWWFIVIYPCLCLRVENRPSVLGIFLYVPWGGVGWGGVITFTYLRTPMMLRHGTFTCTCARTSCYVEDVSRHAGVVGWGGC